MPSFKPTRASTRASRSPSTWVTTTPRPRSRNSLRAIRDRSTDAGIFLDFDGSLSHIVGRPELARPAEGARDAVASLVRRYRVVAVVSGRRSREVAGLLGVPGVRYEGLYGMEESELEDMPTLLSQVRSAAEAVPEAWVEDKAVSVAVHYRQASDPPRARASLLSRLRPVAIGAGLVVVEGKMVLELVPAERPMKGGAVERIAAELGLRGALYAGDDAADLDAFAALDRLAEGGLLIIKVAVEGPETPTELLSAADRRVPGPGGLVELLRRLS